MSNKIPKEVYNTVIKHIRKAKLKGDESKEFKDDCNPEDLLKEIN